MVGQLESEINDLREEMSKARSELEVGQEHFLKECERLKSAHQGEMSAMAQDLNQLVWTMCVLTCTVLMYCIVSDVRAAATPGSSGK